MAEDTPNSPNPNAPENNGDQAAPEGKKSGVSAAVDRFRSLPRPAQIALLVVAFFFLITLMRGGDDAPPPAPEGPAVATDRRVVDNGDGEGDEAFTTLGTSRESLQRGFISQQQLALSQLRNEVEEELGNRGEQLENLQQTISQQALQMEQMIATFNDQMRTMEEANARYRDEIARIAEEARRQAGASAQPPPLPDFAQNQQRKSKTRISQTPLGGGRSGPGIPRNEALLQGIAKTATGRSVDLGDNEEEQVEHKPFIPPLGFVRGVLLNGVDALAGGGVATPALVRLEGKYKTAMNSTVTLDGCFVLVEFEGDISTERALGRPSRMTCVYPDQGATTYSLAGYVVDARDGIIGVPGVFFEGDASRIAAVMAADFAAGIAQIIEQSQSTFTVSAEGNAQQVLTGDQTRAEIASGANKAVQSLRDYLFERANRVVPFVRIDATREINLVFLSGVELRGEGSAWTLLFDAEAAG